MLLKEYSKIFFRDAYVLIEFQLISTSYLILMEQNVDIQEKQQYLCTEILNEGYQPEDFVDYLNNELGITAELDKITFAQLQNVVKGFKNKKKLDREKEQAENVAKKHSAKEQKLQVIASPQQSPAKPKKITFEKHGNIQEEQFQKTFKCLKFHPQLPVITNPKIEVSDPQRKSVGGIFGLGATSFLLFKINTYDYKWQVRRRYSDFQWLRATICKFFPTYIAPPIPKKNAAKRTQRDLDKRMRILSFFLNDLAMVPEIFQSRYVLGFLSFSNDKQFEELKREADKKEVFQSITSLETETGSVTIKYNQEGKAYMEEIDKFITQAETLYKNITRDSKVLQNLVIDETNTLYRMGNHFADLHLLLRDYNNRLPTHKQTALNDTYITLNNMMVQWGNIVRNQHAYLEKNFKTFFPYIRHELSSFRQLYQKVSAFQQDYFKNRSVLDKKKQRIFMAGDVSKWQIPKAELSNIPSQVLNNRLQAVKVMLPKQSLELDKQKMKYTFYQSQFIQHSKDLLNKGSGRFCQNFKEFAIKIKVNNQQLTELWTEIATNFADPKKKLVVQAPQELNLDKEAEFAD